MKTKLFAAVAAFTFAASAFAQTPPTVSLPPEMDRVLKDYESAWIAKDTAALAKLFTSGGMALPSSQMPAEGEERIRKAYAPHVGSPLNLRAFAYGASGDLGYVIGGWGGAVDRPEYGKFVLVLRKIDGRWMIVADMDNSNRRPSPPPSPSPAPAAKP
jgi:ketosteroid isomerase-like protein